MVMTDEKTDHEKNLHYDGGHWQHIFPDNSDPQHIYVFETDLKGNK